MKVIIAVNQCKRSPKQSGLGSLVPRSASCYVDGVEVILELQYTAAGLKTLTLGGGGEG